MLHIIKDLQDELLELIKDDPVRPEIAAEQRVDQRSQIFVLQDDQTQEPLAVTCVKFLAGIPETVEDLSQIPGEATTAVFYTIWSYARGAGQQLIREAQQHIQSTRPEINTLVTLSPKTEMAYNFHIKNGASVYRENSDTVNYLYT